MAEYDFRAAASRSIHDFDEMYDGTPPWDIGRPQPIFVDVADRGVIEGRVLDAGCGTGEHVLMLAERGFDVAGFDASPKAIAAAERKAQDRALRARFFVWDALELESLGEQFDTVVDSGLFHVFDDALRARYVRSLQSVVRSGGRYVLACFSDREPGDWGPRRVREQEIRETFADGWNVQSIEPVEFEINLDPPIAQAWLAILRRR